MSMILEKLREALAEIGPQRAALDQVENQLLGMIAKLSGSPQFPVRPTNLPSLDFRALDLIEISLMTSRIS
jgi:hypothetical protein